MGWSRPVAILDACVLYPGDLRNLFMYLTVARLMRPYWTDEIHDEWIRSVLRENPRLTRDKLLRTRRLMDEHAKDALVTGYQSLIPSLILPDPDDRHVLAACIVAKAKVIVTKNLRDFPKQELRKHGIDAIHPDDFLLGILAARPFKFCAAARTQRVSLRAPAMDVRQYLASLRREVPKTAKILEERYSRRL